MSQIVAELPGGCCVDPVHRALSVSFDDRADVVQTVAILVRAEVPPLLIWSKATVGLILEAFAPFKLEKLEACRDRALRPPIA